MGSPALTISHLVVSGWDIYSQSCWQTRLQHQLKPITDLRHQSTRPTHPALMQLAFLFSYFERDGSKEVLRVVSVVAMYLKDPHSQKSLTC